MNAVLSIAFLTAAAASSDYGLLEALSGPADTTSIVGNGTLTLGFSESGVVSVFRFSGPCAPNQVEYRGGAPGSDGGGFGFVAAEGVRWLNARNIRLKESAAVLLLQLDGADVTAFVHSTLNVAALRVQTADDTSASAVLWRSDFSPCPRVMPGVPGSERIFPARADLLAFHENGTVYHVRISEVSSATWESAEEFAAGGQEPNWFRKGSGVWIAYSTADGIARALCAADAESTALLNGSRAVGACKSIAELPLDSSRAATLFIAAGETKPEAEAALKTAIDTGFDALLAETEAAWEARLAEATNPPIAEDAVKNLYRRALRQVLLTADPKSGAVARAATAQPPLSIDVPRLGAWSTLALDLANMRNEAERHALFYAQQARTSGAEGVPAGSVPAALFGDGTPAVPDAVLDLHAAAWTLWSLWQHDAFVPDVERDEYRKNALSSAERIAEYVSGQVRMAHNTPVFSFNPAVLRDTADVETLGVALAGLRSAASLVRAAGSDNPHWYERVRELEDILRFRVLDATGNFLIDDPLVLWPAELVAAGDPRWNAAVEAAVARIRSEPGPNSLKTLARAAMLLRDQKEQLRKLEPLLAPTIAPVLEAYPCDTYYAALAVTAILTTYSHGAFEP